MSPSLEHIIRRFVVGWCALTTASVTILSVNAQSQRTPVVSANGPYTTIGEAVRSASPGDTVYIHGGVYREPTIVVDRPLVIIGVGRPVIDGEGERQIMLVTADDVAVSGFVFRNVGVSFIEDRSAVKVDSASGCKIENNTFEDTFFGIYLARTSDCDIRHNTLVARGSSETRSGNGIHLWYCKDVRVEGNRIQGHRDGIYFEFVEDSRIEGNESTANLRYGLHFMFSDRCRYRSNVFRENDAGVAVMYTKNVDMSGNRFLDNWGPASYGLLLKDITDSRIEGNTFRRNTVGIHAEGSNRVIVAGNEFVDNGWAVRVLANSIDNLFTENNFTRNSFDVSTNSRRHYSTFERNYWGRYTGYDLDRDGVGDVPFHPVTLFSLLVEQNEPSLLLLRSAFVELLDSAERALPSLTPEMLVDRAPLMARAKAGPSRLNDRPTAGARLLADEE